MNSISIYLRDTMMLYKFLILWLKMNSRVWTPEFLWTEAIAYKLKNYQESWNTMESIEENLAQKNSWKFILIYSKEKKEFSKEVAQFCLKAI